MESKKLKVITRETCDALVIREATREDIPALRFEIRERQWREQFDGEFHGAYGWNDLHKLAALCPD